MKILFGHGYSNRRPAELQWIEAWLARLRAANIDVHPIQIGLEVPGVRLSWRELDSRWRRGDRKLLELYERVACEARHYDVLINSGALNLHPEFLHQLNTINVLHSNDDPESSQFTKPVAAAHDLCMIGNIAELDTYRSWGVPHVYWRPMGFMADDLNPNLTEEDILTKPRTNDLVLLCERVTHYRRQKVDTFARAFPQGIYRGLGWPKGFLPEQSRVPLLQNTKIGINIHNSTGPINFRTYYLPANGILQICDNKSHLGKIFELGKEVIGYDTIDEAIDLCRYYLAHEAERQLIAVAGWKRALKDYNEIAAFQVFVRGINAYCQSNVSIQKHEASVFDLTAHQKETRLRRLAYYLVFPIMLPCRFSVRVGLAVYRRLVRGVATAKAKGKTINRA